jgi:adenylylsulfate kinase
MNNVVWHAQKITKLDRAALNHQKPFVLWLTGLSGSGKSTLASALDEFFFKQGLRSYLLDGDNIRHGLNKDLGFDYDSRVENIRRIGEVAKLMVDAGLVVITAFISPFRSDRGMVRSMFEAEEFIEVFVGAPLEVCERRDPKGLYKKARSGLVKEFTGIDSPYEKPLTAEISLDSDKQTIKEEMESVLQYLVKHSLINVDLK